MWHLGESGSLSSTKDSTWSSSIGWMLNKYKNEWQVKGAIDLGRKDNLGSKDGDIKCYMKPKDGDEVLGREVNQSGI